MCVGEVVAVWQMDEETTADSRSLLSLLPASSLSLARSLATEQEPLHQESGGDGARTRSNNRILSVVSDTERSGTFWGSDTHETESAARRHVHVQVEACTRADSGSFECGAQMPAGGPATGSTDGQSVNTQQLQPGCCNSQPGKVKYGRYNNVSYI